MARYRVFFEKLNDIGPEVMDQELLDYPIAYRDLIITNKNLAGKSLREIRTKIRAGCKASQINSNRSGNAIYVPETIVNRGDLLKISGLLA